MSRIRATKSSIDYTNKTPALIMKNETPQEMRREYTALRDIFQKRFKRIEAASRPGEADYLKQSEFYTKWHGGIYPDGVPKLKDVPANRVPYLLAEMKRELLEIDTTIPEIKAHVANRLNALHEAGYTYVNKENLHDFGRFMERYRARKLGNVVGSTVVAELYGTYRVKGFTPEEILQNWELFDKEQQTLQTLSMDEINTKLESIGLKFDKRSKRWK